MSYILLKSPHPCLVLFSWFMAHFMIPHFMIFHTLLQLTRLHPSPTLKLSLFLERGGGLCSSNRWLKIWKLLVPKLTAFLFSYLDMNLHCAFCDMSISLFYLEHGKLPSALGDFFWIFKLGHRNPMQIGQLSSLFYTFAYLDNRDCGAPDPWSVGAQFPVFLAVMKYFNARASGLGYFGVNWLWISFDHVGN